MLGIAADIIKVFVLGAAGFLLAFLTTPLLTHFLYKYKLWRKEVRTKSVDGGELTLFKQFRTEGETSTPRFGGILIWGTVLILAILFYFLSQVNIWGFSRLNFLNRSETWLPLFALVAASLLGMADDFLQVFGRGKYIGGGLGLKKRLAAVAVIGLIGGWWCFAKLGWNTLHIPGMGDITLGFWYIPLFIVVMLATYAGGVVDGLDGLAGGVFGSIFAAFAVIAFSLGQVNLAGFCAVILGAILAFLWFNIPPARFYMGETGTLGLCAVLTVIVFLTDSVLVLPIIGALLVVEAGSVIIQLVSKKLRHKKIFLAAPVHYHYEAKGWPHYKVTMRFWIIGIVAAIVGVAIRLLG
ncbi:MAG: hypothetical protein AAB620_00880 [Patescibacteria group bacterium]